MTDLPQAVLDAADVTAVSQLVLTERESRDLGRWETLRACYWPDSRVRISWIDGTGEEFVEGSIDMAKRGVRATHRVGPPVVRLNGDRAASSMVGAIDIPAVVHGVEAFLSSHTRFLHRAERRDGRWGLVSFEAIYTRDELVATIPSQALAVRPEDLEGFRHSYRMLSYILAAADYEVNHELAGIDRPETVKAILDETDAWLAGES